MNSPIGVVHGRFQPFHNDHLKYVLAAKKYCDYIVVGITSPDPFQSAAQEQDRNRGTAFANPCTYFERAALVESALLAENLSHNEFTIVPFPIEFPERIQYYAPKNAMYYITIYDNWGEEKLSRLKDLGLATTVLWRRQDKGISASSIRTLIFEGDKWQHLVPQSVALKIKELEIDKKIRSFVETNKVK